MQGRALPPASSTAKKKKRDERGIYTRQQQHNSSPYACLRTFLCRRVNRAGQLRVRLRRLGGHHNVGAVASRLQRDRLADAARGARNEERPAGEFTAGVKVNEKIVDNYSDLQFVVA